MSDRLMERLTVLSPNLDAPCVARTQIPASVDRNCAVVEHCFAMMLQYHRYCRRVVSCGGD